MLRACFGYDSPNQIEPEYSACYDDSSGNHLFD